MKDTNVRESIKTGCSLVTGMGCGLLLGAIGGVLIKNLGGNTAVKILASIGWFGLSCKLTEDAKEGMEGYIDDIYEIVDTIKDGEEPNVIQV